MTSKEALNKIYQQAYLGLETDAPELVEWLNHRKEEVEKDLEIFEIIKKHLRHFEAYYKNQAEWGREEFRFILESDNIWLEEEQREQYKKDFNTLKEWYFKEVKND